MTPTNPYHGVNAHLNSWLLAHGLWADLHLAFISELKRTLSRQLAPRYFVTVEPTLQLMIGLGERNTYRPDAAIYPRAHTPSQPHALPHAPHALTLDLPTLFEPDEDALPALVIVREQQPVVWIEFLSPSNVTPIGERVYRRKQLEVLKAGITLFDIDFVYPLPDRTRWPHPSAPYRVALLMPHPSFEAGQAALYLMHVDEPLKPVLLPLQGSDVVTVDLEALYQRMFEDNAYGLRVDYTQPPLHMERYAPEEQDRIRAVMQRAKERSS